MAAALWSNSLPVPGRMKCCHRRKRHVEVAQQIGILRNLNFLFFILQYCHKPLQPPAPDNSTIEPSAPKSAGAAMISTGFSINLAL
jgi:hypothetical protein